MVQLQVFGVNALLNGFDVISVVPTGAGKTLVIFLFAMSLPKMLGVANTMVVVGIAHNLRQVTPYYQAFFPPGMPLTMLIQQQMENPLGCPVLCLSMGGHLTGSSDAAELSSTGESLSVAEATSGKYRILFMHPEASITDSGQQLLREFSNMDVIHGLVIDEVHQVHFLDPIQRLHPTRNF